MAHFSLQHELKLTTEKGESLKKKTMWCVRQEGKKKKINVKTIKDFFLWKIRN